MSDANEAVNQAHDPQELPKAKSGGGDDPNDRTLYRHYDRNARTLYRATACDPGRGYVIFWATSRKAATREANRYVHEHREDEKDADRKECFKVVAVEPVSVPTTKAGLCDWLNRLYRSIDWPCGTT